MNFPRPQHLYFIRLGVSGLELILSTGIDALHPGWMDGVKNKYLCCHVVCARAVNDGMESNFIVFFFFYFF